MFTRDQVTEAARLGNLGHVADAEGASTDAMQQGAYAVGGILLIVDLESHVNDKITVYNIKPVVVTRKPALDGPLIAISAEGESGDEMQFDLDSPSPTAMRVDQDVEEKLDGPFFRSHTIILGHGQKDTLIMTFLASSASYQFRLAVSFEVGGKRYTQTLDQNGQPFRVTPDLCTYRYKMWPYDAKDAARALKVLTKLKPMSVTQAGGDFAMRPITPDAYLDQSECRKPL
jgi:hypothetical protein